MFGIDQTSTYIPNCYTGSVVPGKSIVKSFGLITLVKKGIAGNVISEFDGLIEDFSEDLKELGANGCINFRFETGAYQQQGSACIKSYILVYGEAVVLKTQVV